MKRANWGRIIFISSESAVQIRTEMIHYGTSKTAQLAVSRTLTESVAGTGAGQVEKEFVEHVRSTSLIRCFVTGAARRVDGDVVKSAFCCSSSLMESTTRGERPACLQPSVRRRSVETKVYRARRSNSSWAAAA